MSVGAVVTLVNNTIENNEAQGGAGGIAELNNGSCVGKNNILYGNKGKQWEGKVSLTYSCSSQQLSGTGNITADPMYVGVGGNDYHLKKGSPCIDKGDLSSDKDPDGTTADMGALYYNQGTGIVVENPCVSSFGFNIYQTGSSAVNQAACIFYQLPHAVDVELVINNAAGQNIRTLINSMASAGSHRAVWDGRNGAGCKVVPGIYFYRFSAGSYRNVLKMTLMQ